MLHTDYIYMKKFRIFLIFFIFNLFPFTIYTQNNANTTSITGFNGSQWGTFYKDIKDKFRTLQNNGEADPGNNTQFTIVSDVEDSELIVENNKILYRYFFYQKPEGIEQENQNIQQNQANQTPADNNNVANTEGTKNEGRLVLVESTFPYISSDLILNKLELKYGKPTSSSINKNNRGTYLWSTDRGYIVQIVDQYDLKPFTRSIFYISTDIINEMKSDFPRYMQKSELNYIKNLIQ